jgi:hypothetical protein
MLTPRLVINAALVALFVSSPALVAMVETQPDSAEDVRRKRALRQLEENRRAQEREAEDVTYADMPPMDPALVEQFDAMLAIIADPEMEGRVPGSQGIEKAADYIQGQVEALGLRPAFIEDTDLNGSIEDLPNHFRQPMQMGTHTAATSVTLAMGDSSYSDFDDASPLAFSGAQTVTAPVVFCGYGIVSGPNSYLGYETNESVEGKVAIVLNYEPMNADGSSQWKQEGWTHNAHLTYKVTALDRRGAAGVIIVNPPGAMDDRVDVLETVESTTPPTNRMGTRGGPEYDIPVVHATPEVVGSILTYLGSEDDLPALIAQANAGGIVRALGERELTLGVEMERTPRMTDNIGAVLPGRGELADEYIVIGAHYDHVGFGKFGTRRETDKGKLHPGADDNGTGTAATILAAQLLSQRYETLSEQDNARSILFLWFTAEESGLNGSRYYVENPIAPLEDHLIMLNMDMIGTLSDGLLEVGGFEYAEGFEERAKPKLDASGIPYSTDVSVGSGRSDHASFNNAGVPGLFFFTGLHERYHAPEDVPELIDDEGCVRVASLVSDIAFDTAMLVGDIPHPDDKQADASSEGPKVRVGIIPSNARNNGGMRVERVFEDTSASQAGLRPGDVITKWNGTPIDAVETWMPIISTHAPGDVVTLEVQRGDETLQLEMTLRAIE